MGVLYDYFAAPTDAAAAEMVQAGPGGPEPASPALVEAIRARDRDAIRLARRPKVRLSDSNVLVLAVKGVSPDADMRKLEALLTGQHEDVIAARPRANHLLARHAEGQWVVTLTDELQAALAAAPGDQLAAAADVWSQGEEGLYGRAITVENATNFLVELADLARRAKQRGERLYCWICL